MHIGFIWYRLVCWHNTLLHSRLQGGTNTREQTEHLSADEPLPIVSSNVILSNGEMCHYCGGATCIKTTNVIVGYSSERHNTKISKSKRKSMSLVNQRTTPIGRNVQKRTNGVLSITNTRIVFSGNNCAFDKKITALSSITPYKDGIAFQFGSQQYPLQTRDSEYIYMKYWPALLISQRMSLILTYQYTCKTVKWCGMPHPSWEY